MATKKQVSIIYNDEDGAAWTDYLKLQLEDGETINAKTFLQQDELVFERSDPRSETRILQSNVVLVIVTPNHMDYLLSGRCLHASYDRLVTNGENGVLFFVGVTKDHMDESTVKVKRNTIFPGYERWVKVWHGVDDEEAGINSVKELLKKIVEIFERPENITCKFNVSPKMFICEEETETTVIIDEEVASSAVVRARILGTYVDFARTCEYVNPYTFTFMMPTCEEGEATISLEIDNRSLSNIVKIHYQSYQKSSDVAAVSLIYCHLLDSLLKLIKTKKVLNNQDIDVKLSEIFDHTIDLPAAGYEKLFGIYQYFTEEHSRSIVPTLAHLAAMYDLKELMASLQDLPQFLKVIEICNKESQTPKDIALKNNFKELTDYIQEIQQTMEIYIDVVYKKKYQNPGDYNANPDVIEDYQACAIMPMDEYATMDSFGSHPPYNATADPTSDDFYMEMSFENGPRGVKTSVSSDCDNYGFADTEPHHNGKLKEFLRSVSEPIRKLTKSKDSKKNVQTESAVVLPPRGIKPHSGNIRRVDVEKEFSDWQRTQAGGAKCNFKEKREKMKNSKQELSKVGTSVQIGRPIMQTPGALDKQVAPAGHQRAYKEPEYVERQQIAPPIPRRAGTITSSPSFKREESIDSPELYLELTGDEENYDYPEVDTWLERKPAPPPGGNQPNLSIPNRLSNASTGSRASSASMGSGRGSTFSSGSGVDIGSGDDCVVQSRKGYMEDSMNYSDKRNSINAKVFQRPPVVPTKSRRPVPNPSLSPHDDVNDSIPNEPPPPPPGSPFLPARNPEPFSPEDETKKRLERMGAVSMYPVSNARNARPVTKPKPSTRSK